jgi:RimJ/RimL family protein N-acetyltransferase
MADAVSGSSMEILRDGSRVSVRPIQRQDVELERRFIEGLSPEARHFRFGYTMRTPGDALLRQLTDIDPERDAALIALAGEGDTLRQVGVARYSSTGDGRAEIAVTVGDDWRNRGLATALMSRLIALARQRGLQVLYSVDASDNEPMRKLAGHLGFECSASPDDATQRIYTLRLKPAT